MPMSWRHPDDVTLSLPISELALEVLRDFKQSSGWNRRNWMLESEQWGTLRSKEAKRALGEAWAWLDSRGLIAPDTEQSAAHSYFITRLGEQAGKWHSGHRRRRPVGYAAPSKAGEDRRAAFPFGRT